MITKKLMSVLIVLFLLLTHAETQVVQDAQPSQSVIPKRPFNHDARIVTTRLEKEDRTVVTLSEMPVPLPKKKGYSLKLRSSFDYVGKEPIIPMPGARHGSHVTDDANQKRQEWIDEIWAKVVRTDQAAR